MNITMNVENYSELDDLHKYQILSFTLSMEKKSIEMSLVSEAGANGGVVEISGLVSFLLQCLPDDEFDCEPIYESKIRSIDSRELDATLRNNSWDSQLSSRGQIADRSFVMIEIFSTFRFVAIATDIKRVA